MRLTDKKLLLFDLDGTLIDSVPDLAASVNFMLQELDRATFPEKRIRSWVGNGAQTLVKRALSGSSEIDTTLETELFEKALAIFLHHYKNNLCNQTLLYPHVKETLQTLYEKGYILAIITNKPFDFVAPILQKLQINSYFSAVLGADSLQQKKPHPLPLLHLCQKFGINTQHAVMIGDSKNDMLAAQAANIDTIAVNYGYNYEESISIYNPSALVDNFADIVALLEPKIAIIGGGIAGSSVALYLANQGLRVTLFEQNSTLVDGPPMCHLHAGGNLYREISDTQCLRLLEESIEFMRLYPHGIDYRPTVIAIPKEDKGEPLDLLPRLQKLQKRYEELIALDEQNKCLGESQNYFKLYSKEELQKLRALPQKQKPCTLDEWMIIVAKELDFSQLKFPLIMVQEYGLNVFRLAASATLLLQNHPNITLKTNTQVKQMTHNTQGYTINGETFDYLINAAGFKSGEIDDMLGLQRRRYVEFKAAYVTQCPSQTTLWPEIIFHGQRGTPQGMAQFTPYPNGYFQLHGMTKDITLFDNGLVQSSTISAQPKLDKKFLDKIYTGWSLSDAELRSKRAVEHISRYIPAFKNAKFRYKPLYGAQQIPGDDANLRAAEVSFESHHYARCEIVKGSSVLAMAQAIAENIHKCYLLKKLVPKQKVLQTIPSLEEEKVDALAEHFAKERGYPQSLAYRNRNSNIC